MAKIIYSKNGNVVVGKDGKRRVKSLSITEAPASIQYLWDQAHSFGANIVRVRSDKNRFGNDTGRTFNSFHHNKVSMYRQKEWVHSDNALYFAKKIPLTKVNKGMQILEVYSNIDVQDSLETVSAIRYYAESSFFERLWNRIRYGTPMSITS